jgi:lysophospholipase L1-like esterase
MRVDPTRNDAVDESRLARPKVKSSHHRSSRRVLPAAALLFGSCFLSLTAVELILRQVLPFGYMLHPPEVQYVFTPTASVMPGVSGESRFRTNRWGVRADEILPTHRRRILAIGGSTTECLYLGQEEMWTQLLQNTLNGQQGDVWVGNGGMSGTTSRHHLLAMQYLPLDEMSIDTVLLLAGANDLSIRLSHGDQYDVMALDDERLRGDLMNETFRALTYGRRDQPWLQRSAIWQVSRGVSAGMSRAESGRVEQDPAGLIYETWRRHRREAAEVRSQLPDLTAAVAEYSSNLRSIHEIATRRGIRVIFMTQPTLWRADLPPRLERLLWFGGIGDFQIQPGRIYYSATALRSGLERYNEAMLDVCRTVAIGCIDLAAIDRDTSLFYDDVHLNEAGAHVVASVIAQYLSTFPFHQGERGAK